MDPRANLFESPVALRAMKHLTAADAATHDVLPETTRELVKIRASQINGCGLCLDMHTKDAAEAGEAALRLNLVATWREADVFDEAEKAALALTEVGCRIADGGEVPDEVWGEAARHYDDEQMVALVSQIANINAFNRINVLTRQRAGHYRPGHFTAAS